MGFEIISIPNAVFINKRWQLEAFIRMSGENPYYKKKYFEIDRTPSLPIGTEIKNFSQADKTYHEDKENLQKENLEIENLGIGEVVSFKDLKTKIFDFTIPKKLHDDTRLYKIVCNGELYVFYCYEFFRCLLFLTGEIGQYIFKNNFFEIALDKYEITNDGPKRKLSLTFNEYMPVSLIRNPSFLNNITYLLFCKPIRDYWNDIKYSITSSKRDFSFTNLDLKNVKLNVTIKKYEKFNLVLHINNLDINETLDFDEIEVYHPKLIKRIGGKGQAGGKKKDLVNEFPTLPKISDDDYDPKNGKSKVPINFSNLLAGRTPKVSYIKKTVVENKSKFSAVFKINDPKKDKNFSFGGGTENKDTVKGSLESNIAFEEFDYSEIPNGLFSFCRAFEITANDLELNFTYQVINTPEQLTFSDINGSKRKVLLIEVTYPFLFYLLEVDSSDDKYISTLTCWDIKDISKDEFFKKTILKMSANKGAWPIQFLSEHCKYDNLRHPKGYKKENKRNNKGNAIIEEKLANNLYNFLVAV